MTNAQATPDMASKAPDPTSPTAFWARVDELLGPRTFRDVEAATGIKYHTLYSAKERGSKFSAANAKKLAAYLGVSYDWLATGVGSQNDWITDRDREFWDSFQKLPPDEQEAIRRLVLRGAPTKDDDKQQE